MNKIQKHSKNVMWASKISKKYAYKCVDSSRYNKIKGAMTKCVEGNTEYVYIKSILCKYWATLVTLAI